MFIKYSLDEVDENIFSSLANATNFETFSESRSCAIIVEPSEDTIPIIRTTTAFKLKSQYFKEIHHRIIKNIKKACNMKESIEFNNAMVEIYTSEYFKMGFHTDLALDLKEDTFICLYSCYEDPNEQHPRVLQVQNKETKEFTEFSLHHNSFVLFSTQDNNSHIHKIVSENKATKSRWLGLTLRTSKTYIRYKDDTPHFVSNDQVLKTASESEKRQFYNHKSLENKNVGYQYPEINYTLSIH
ncbi:hypothetical protein AKO1_014758 [Acrasis kona]|uniref:Alpha-ketoglutarate-dependent dioxygenase AlkB-like domain-containing protein n=1 Tax=Acrasis kona TaxID=1008807 RepID=A0AAW2Z293_9EUKA